MNFIKNNLANAITLSNLFFGCIGVISLIHGEVDKTMFCLMASLVLDFFDGFVARATKTNSLLGGQLDSLADMVSFGVLPGVTMYVALQNYTIHIGTIDFTLQYFGLIITVFSCLRLAIFNLDEEQSYYFKGLNTPSNTIWIFSMYYLYQQEKQLSFLFQNPMILLILVALSSFLLISPIKMIALKFRSMQLKDNYPKLLLLLGIILLFIIFKNLAVPLSIVYYMLISILFQKQLK